VRKNAWDQKEESGEDDKQNEKNAPFQIVQIQPPGFLQPSCPHPSPRRRGNNGTSLDKGVLGAALVQAYETLQAASLKVF
jgi:hypothetical protein